MKQFLVCPLKSENFIEQMGDKECESSLEKFKEDYSKLQAEYVLPFFEELNKDFQIEKLADTETDYLIREIRKIITDRFANYLRFVEAFLHPTNSPMFVFSLVKLISVEDKKILTSIYEKLAKSEMKVVELDLDFVEEKEVEFVRHAFNLWQEIKKDLLIFVKKIEDNWDSKPAVNGKGYFG